MKKNILAENMKRFGTKNLSEQEENKMDRNSPEWKNLFNKLKGLYNPKIITFMSYDEPPEPHQSLNWGTAQSNSNTGYGLAISSDSENIKLFSDDKDLEKQLHNWWGNKGYQVNSMYVTVDFSDVQELHNDLKFFFEEYPPKK